MNINLQDLDNEKSFTDSQKRMKTLNFVLLSIITLGVYPLIYLWVNTPRFEKHFSKSFFEKGLLLIMIICFGLSIGFDQLGTSLIIDGVAHLDRDLITFGGILSSLSGYFTFTMNVLYVVWAWKARNAFEQYTTEKGIVIPANKFFTVIFSVFYIHYLTNKLMEKEGN